jgi:hypothetical protein
MLVREMTQLNSYEIREIPFKFEGTSLAPFKKPEKCAATRFLLKRRTQ